MQKTAKPTMRGKMDFAILATICVLLAIGVVMLFSASYYYAETQKDNGLFYVQKQLLFIAIAIPLMLAITRMDYRLLLKFRIPEIMLGASIVLLILVLIFGKTTNGAKRWLEIGSLSVQPSEVAKFGLIVYMAAFMPSKPNLMKDVKHGLLPMLMVIGMVCVLIMAQPNMSMAVIVGMMGIVMLYVGGVEGKYIAMLLFAGMVLFVLFAYIEPYRMARLVGFRNPWEDAAGTGYQLIQSFYALGAGGLFGQGFNNSRQKLLYLTYGESDFVFAIVGEELGFIGAMLVILLYIFIVYRGMRVALRCRNRFGSMLAAGITVVFALQVLVNVGVVTGSMPTTGQALPFMSAGGTSLLIFMSAMGVLLNISRDTSEL